MDQNEAVRRAQTALGRLYRWGARGPDRFDCEGLWSWSWDRQGTDWTAAHLHGQARPVKPGDELPGDAVFPLRPDGRVTHVAMYIGQDHDDPHRIIVIEAGGGDRTTTTDEIATRQNARVRYSSWARNACEVRRWQST